MGDGFMSTGSVAGGSSLSGAGFDQSAQAAEFIFVGIVRRVGASDVPTIPASEATAIVAVEEVLHAPDALAGFAGQEVTVRLAAPGSVSEGMRATFFTTVLAFAEGLGLAELEHHPADAEVSALASRVADARASATEQRTQDHVARATVIVSGRVADVRAPSTESVLSGGTEAPVSEHDPQWMEAVINVDSVVKGTQPPGETVVLFPSSMDVAWARAPKFHVGQEGVYLLHRQEPTAELSPTLRAGGPAVLTALDPVDVQPSEEIDHVRQLSAGAG
jgi:hypothetical protein